jgi:hypothetical protein
MSVGLKLIVSSYSFREKPFAEQVAYFLEDVIQAVENGKTEI